MTMTSTVYTYRGRNRDITCGDATGTPRGYQRHYRRGEPACDLCREGERLRSIERRNKIREERERRTGGRKHPTGFDLDATKRALDRYLQARRERKRKEGAGRG